MAEVLRDLATRHARVALKRVDAASAMGMEVFDAAEIDADAEGRVLHFLRHNGWTEGDTILATAWVPEVTASPSCQVWVPPTGSIRVDGVYEQVLTEGKMFVGSVPSSLPTSIQRLIGFQSRIVAGALRWLGYQGRCSFDFVVSGGNVAFVECNGRWGARPPRCT
jgi:hypothetical protein